MFLKVYADMLLYCPVEPETNFKCLIHFPLTSPRKGKMRVETHAIQKIIFKI